MVGEAIGSVLAQTVDDYELIVIDDGSSDETLRHLNRYGSRLKVIRQTNRGVSAARNLGVRHACGTYVAFLDSDDLWLPGKLSVQSAFMEQNRTAQICQTDEIWIRNGVRINPKVKHRKPSGDIFLPSLKLCLVSPSAVMLRRSFFTEMGGFDENYPVCEDYDLWLRIAVAHPVPLINQALVIKRGGHADQLSRSTWGMDRYRVFTLRKLLRSGLSGDRRMVALANLRQKLGVLISGAHKRGKAREIEDYQKILAEFAGEYYDRTGNSRILDREGFSPEDAGTLA
jgi:glycosyltransferase involved in cell wall biosynthesis